MVGNKSRSQNGNATVVQERVRIESLPKFIELKAKVDEIVDNSSWWEINGIDCMMVLFSGFVLFPFSCYLMGTDSLPKYVLGVFILGFAHNVYAAKGGHLATHGSLGGGKSLVRPISVFFVEIVGSFSEELAYAIHIKEHHPYTNIIGKGDSSTWKVPFLPAYTYMFLAPALFLPIATILVSIAGLIEKRSFFGLLKYIIRLSIGQGIYAYLVMNISGMSLTWTLISIWASRGIFSMPYIHINIFQHIGLPMYAQEHKPVRMYQMSSGVLNLSRNPILDYCFGHSLINAHVEHHLFPMLSDHMCLKIKPVVSAFLKDNGLPYHEKTYFNRLHLFINKYETLMVKAPPITHFVGIQ